MLFAELLLVDFVVSRASAIFVGVYEPAKQKLLKSLPENLSALAHLVSFQPVELLYALGLLEARRYFFHPGCV